MSKIGKKPVSIPSGVTVTVTDSGFTVTGPKGELHQDFVHNISIEVNESEAVVVATKQPNAKQTRMNLGLIRSLLNNMVEGVTNGFTKRLKLVGTGYRVAQRGQGLTLTVGFSHPVEVDAVEGITFGVEGNDTIIVSGIDKHMVGQVAANIRKVRPPEPYKGKGIRYEDEEVRRKQGKTLAKAA
ncbi:50S ribosomal protein L6 [Candidatus Woesebacteria bacterium]|nr:50S ribosomal protein L6 [Candidatus Woesebacteria bacterium]MCD8507630.1 50S ribosomal protein L6 [Candidatus Woesebacteria bacterium]MCD8526784.1 50S ribosomal protein L6 [Candidatus Woesebacteria bacterium]MCD8546470.1 50S ribosomal protein L6 [Candidatus Woesebacteria bacterium]